MTYVEDGALCREVHVSSRSSAEIHLQCSTEPSLAEHGDARDPIAHPSDRLPAFEIARPARAVATCPAPRPHVTARSLLELEPIGPGPVEHLGIAHESGGD